jgi:hypothetical protein
MLQIQPRPWMAFMSRACPRTNSMPCSAQRSATQYQQKRHSTATTSPAAHLLNVCAKTSLALLAGWKSLPGKS